MKCWFAVLYGSLAPDGAVLKQSGVKPGIGHISPEAAAGGPIGLVEDGDEIEINIENRMLDLHVSEEELARRRES